jgi:hypothetical protein
MYAQSRLSSREQSIIAYTSYLTFITILAIVSYKRIVA